VDRVRGRAPAAAEFIDREIADAGIRQMLWQLVPAELREFARARETADIGDRLDVMGLQQLEKLRPCARGMADGPELASLCHALHALTQLAVLASAAVVAAEGGRFAIRHLLAFHAQA